MPGLVAAASQEERAQGFKRYVESVLDNPNFVGCHLFQYVDQPNTGRVLDGENYAIGFVDVTDTPYPELVKAAREVNGTIYSRRGGK
jgi:agarase